MIITKLFRFFKTVHCQLMSSEVHSIILTDASFECNNLLVKADINVNTKVNVLEVFFIVNSCLLM